MPGRVSRPDAQRLVLIGVFTKTQGTKGGIRLLPQFDDLESFEGLKTSRLFIKPGSPNATLREQLDTAYREVTIEDFQFHQRFVIIYLEEAPDMTAAELLRSHEVYVYEDELWDLPAGQYYTYQLVGLELVDEAGASLGTVKEVRPSVHDYLVVEKPDGAEYLVPYVPEIVVGVDLPGKRMTVRLPEGIDEI